MSDMDLSDMSRFEELKDETRLDLTDDDDILESEEQAIRILDTIKLSSPGLTNLEIDVPGLSHEMAVAVVQFRELKLVKINSWELERFSGNPDMKEQVAEFADSLMSNIPSLCYLTIYVYDAEESWLEYPDISWLQEKYHEVFEISWFNYQLILIRVDDLSWMF